MKFRRGFTFLELMLALIIVSIVAGAVSISLYSAFKARDGIVNSLEPMRQASTAVEFMRRDLESALPPTGYITDEFIGSPADTETGTTSLFFDAAVGAPRTVTSPADVRLVEYAVIEQNKDHVLVRRVTSNLLPPSTDPIPPDEEWLCRGVRSFTLRYYDGTTGTDPTSWTDTWDSTVTASLGVTQTNVLPYAVDVTLELEPVKTGDQPIVIHRIIQLPCAVPASQPATTGLTP